MNKTKRVFSILDRPAAVLLQYVYTRALDRNVARLFPSGCRKMRRMQQLSASVLFDKHCLQVFYIHNVSFHDMFRKIYNPGPVYTSSDISVSLL